MFFWNCPVDSTALSTFLHNPETHHKAVFPNFAEHTSDVSQVNTVLSSTVSDLQYKYKLLSQKLKRTEEKYSKCLSELKNLEDKYNKNSENINILNKLTEKAQQADEKAIFLLDLFKNFDKKVPRWSEITIRLCTIWRFCSPKGYQFCRKYLVQLPARTTISRYLGKYHGQNQLIRERLAAEIRQLKQPIERICSLIVDDMSIKEKVHYSRLEDHIYGFETYKSDTVGQNPKIANKMLCFVIHGLSTKYTLPVGYFFHGSLTNKDFYTLTMDVMQMVTDCGYIILRLVADNYSTNVALFKRFGEGTLKYCIDHPTLQHIPLFLSFDFCHAIKNARNQFLQHNMDSSSGIISSSYLKSLYDLQKGMPIKPIRYLTKKHLFPTTFDKMNVLRAVQIFSPPVTASLKFLKEAGDERFVNADGTITYMETMYQYFQIHNVSSTNRYIRVLDSNVAPYIDISDERLEWLDETFPNYIDDIRNTSVSAGLQGLSQETAQALKFTAKSTSLCVKYLLDQVGFYYVLTRSFSSDAIEATFSHVRLRGGSNDATDARAADYALRQILRCGIIKASSSANTSENISYISSAAALTSNHDGACNTAKELQLPNEIKIQSESLSTHIEPDYNIYSASVAFLSGYIIKKLNDKFHCDNCLAPFLSTTVPGPLLKLILLQDRGGLVYPNAILIGLVQKIADIVQEAVPYLNLENACSQLLTFLYPVLQQNPAFYCLEHKQAVCEIIIKNTVRPVLNNICMEKTDLLKKKVHKQ